MTQPFPYSGFQDGAVIEPLSLTSNLSDLQLADPALFYVLDFCSWVITNYPGSQIVQTAKLQGAATAIQQAIGYRYPSPPSPEVFTATQIKFPLLSIWRTRTTTGRKTASWEHDRGYFELVYAYPPGLTAGQKEALLPHLHAVAQALHNKVTQGYDPNYVPPGGVAGQSPWSAGFANLEDVGFGEPYGAMAQSVEYTSLQDTGNLLAPCIHMFGYMTERDAYLKSANGAVTFAAADITTNLQAPDGTSVPSNTTSSTRQAPTITSLSVASGTHLGGTVVTLNGTNFLSGVPYGAAGTVYPYGSTGPAQLNVLFGTTPAPQNTILWVSSTAVQCQTPVMAGAGIVAVTLMNPDGQGAILNSAFTFT